LPIAGSRFKRSLLGYRPREVDAVVVARDTALAESGRALAAALADLEASRRRMAELEQVADRLSDRVVAREGEIEALHAELDELRAVSERPAWALVDLAEELESIRSQARGQATRIRLLALREAAQLSERIGQLARGPVETRERLLEIVSEALASVGGERIVAEPQNGTAASAEIAAVNGDSHPRVAEDVFVGSVELEVGPLSDFSQLVGFEDAACGIDAASEISVTRFAQGRATLAMRLAEPVELLRELEERAPFEFKVRDTRADRVVLDVDDE
jgi:hypothetical protein